MHTPGPFAMKAPVIWTFCSTLIADNLDEWWIIPCHFFEVNMFALKRPAWIFTEHTLPSNKNLTKRTNPIANFTFSDLNTFHSFALFSHRTLKIDTFVTNCDRIFFLSNHWGFPVVTVTWAFLVYHLPVLPWRWPLPNGMVPVPYPVSRRSWELQKAPKPTSPQPCNPMGFPTCSIEFFKARLDISRLLTHFLLGHMKFEVETLSGESLIINHERWLSMHLKQKGFSQTRVNKSDICNNVVSCRFI